jgi:hypothetical protein
MDDKFVMGLIGVLILLIVVTTSLLNSYDRRIEKLEMRNLWLEMQVGTNKLLIKQTQRMVIPNEIALKEVVKNGN